MENFKENILNEWLKIDYYLIAQKLGFSDKEYQVTDELIYNTIRCLDYLTSMEKQSVNFVVTIIALLWNHADKEKFKLKDVIIKFLSRIGYPTSAIIVDQEFDKNNISFSHLNSLIDEITTTLNQKNNEVQVNDKKFLLTDFQMQIWNSIEQRKSIGISAPTSAGKSFVILLKLVEKLTKNIFDIVYIVPTLCLMTQVTEDFNQMLKNIGIENFIISNSYIQEDDNKQIHIYVLTQEKAISAFSSDENVFDNNLVLVVDEIQNIERITDSTEERAKVLFDTLTEFRYKENLKQVILSGPRIQEIDNVGESIFGFETEEVVTEISPVLNLTYSIRKEEGKYFFKQYCILTDKPICEEIIDSTSITGYGENNYDEYYYNYLQHFIDCVGKGEQNIIFAPTSNSARKIATNISGFNSHKPIERLIDYFRDTINANYSMCESLKNGVAYHHGKLPMHVRSTIEKAISKKWIGTVVCTTTLMQGVNMPAQNIIIRNPHLYTKRTNNAAELSNYEMANLRGRAGRLLKDFIGRTFVMDESAFEETDGYDQTSLFEDVNMELPSGYEKKFDEHKTDIIDIINTERPVDTSMQKYGYLVSYIRQSVLRYGEESFEKMNNVGINLTREQVAAIMYKLDNLTIPKNICIKNRYWDPFVLEEIYQNYTENVPSSPMEYGATAKLDRMLKFLRDNESTNYMYNKHIVSQLQRGPGRGFLKYLCIKWAKGTSLYELLDNKKYNDPEEIEKTIEILQNTVSFHVPLLLKPIFDIKNPESIFLTCMQCGAFEPISRKLIEMGIPRETSLYLYDNFFEEFDISDMCESDLNSEIRTTLKTNIDKIPYWIKIQFENLL